MKLKHNLKILSPIFSYVHVLIFFFFKILNDDKNSSYRHHVITSYINTLVILWSNTRKPLLKSVYKSIMPSGQLYCYCYGFVYITKQNRKRKLLQICIKKIIQKLLVTSAVKLYLLWIMTINYCCFFMILNDENSSKGHHVSISDSITMVMFHVQVSVKFKQFSPKKWYNWSFLKFSFDLSAWLNFIWCFSIGMGFSHWSR